MKILQVNADDGIGGAARAAMRLHLGLCELDLDSTLLVQKKHTDLANVLGPRPMLGFWWEELCPHLDALPVCLYPQRTRALFSIGMLPGSWLRRVAENAPDIVHLHWICNGLVRLESLRRLGRPVVWTLHDSWAFTGGCHLLGECCRYQQVCGTCPVLSSCRDNDLSRKVWKRKKKVYDSVNMTIVTPSRWLAGCAKSSSLLAGKRIEVIPNGLDTEKFRPMNKAEARHLLGLPEDANLVLYCGIHSTVDANKGADLLLEALQGQASQMANCFDLVLLGTTACLGFETLGIKVHTLGRLVDEVSLRIAYASADLLVLPSREESLSYTVMEAMACGVPCVAFDGNGASDLIDHMSTGYLVKPYDTEELGISILRLLGDRLQLDTMAQKSRKKIFEGYDQKHIASRYLNLYQSIV